MSTGSTPTHVRVERGQPSPQELAAVVAVLLTRRVASPAPAPASRDRTAGWHRHGLIAEQYCPRSWRTAARASDREGELR
ncbi:acyl-CoA carboxylase subunit epsilon [Micromonospora sp. NPDC005172]|uniref:acyl-CoA carboxylase subunit epsilon n=1 Tax=Micromonospora sp. NPDC005172 TaxID=3156867 RepID=UPI0033B5EB0D